MEKKYILAIEEWPTNNQVVLFDEEARIVGNSQSEIKQVCPMTGWFEVDAETILPSYYNMIHEVLSKNEILPKQIAGLGFCIDRGSTIIWDKNTGDPVYNAIIWKDERNSDYCDLLRDANYAEYIDFSTGLFIHHYFSASKIHWILDNVADAKIKAKRGELLFGTISTYIIWHLSGGKLHIMDYNCASQTMLFNIRQLCWDEKICDVFDIPLCMLPEVVDSSKLQGHTDTKIFPEVAIPIAGIVGNFQSELFGLSDFNPGVLRANFRFNGSFYLNTGKNPIKSEKGFLTAIEWKINDMTLYALEGSIMIGGLLLDWLMKNLNLISSKDEAEILALEAGSNGGVYIVPSFGKLGIPYWEDAKGVITGLSLSSERKHIVRAALESIAYQTYDILRVLESDSEVKINTIELDGVFSENTFLMQFMADITRIPVKAFPTYPTTLGVAFLSGMAVKLWTKEQITDMRPAFTTYLPSIDEAERERRYLGWQTAVRQVRQKEDSYEENYF